MMDLDMNDAAGQHELLEMDAEWDLSAAAVLATARGDKRAPDLVVAAKKMYDLAERARQENLLPWPQVSLEDDMERMERVVSARPALCGIKGVVWGEAAMLMMHLITNAPGLLN